MEVILLPNRKPSVSDGKETALEHRVDMGMRSKTVPEIEPTVSRFTNSRIAERTSCVPRREDVAARNLRLSIPQGDVA
jgi:hypothetical protein